MSKLFSKENKEAFAKPLNLDHPILVQVLGICSALAVTSQLKPAIVMGLAVTIITAFSNVIISVIRNTIPNRIRIIVQLVVVATLVTNAMVVAAVNPMTDLGRTIYQACGQELMNTKNWNESYTESEVRAEVAAKGGPLLAFGLGESASIIGKADAGLENAPFATFAQKHYYSRYILLFRLKKIGSGSVSQTLPEFAGVIDCEGNTLRAAQHIIKRL